MIHFSAPVANPVAKLEFGIFILTWESQLMLVLAQCTAGQSSKLSGQAKAAARKEILRKEKKSILGIKIFL